MLLLMTYNPSRRLRWWARSDDRARAGAILGAAAVSTALTSTIIDVNTLSIAALIAVLAGVIPALLLTSITRSELNIRTDVSEHDRARAGASVRITDWRDVPALDELIDQTVESLLIVGDAWISLLNENARSMTGFLRRGGKLRILLDASVGYARDGKERERLVILLKRMPDLLATRVEVRIHSAREVVPPAIVADQGTTVLLALRPDTSTSAGAYITIKRIKLSDSRLLYREYESVWRSQAVLEFDGDPE